MPLLPGKSKEVVDRNFAELMASRTRAGKSRRKHGMKKARQIAWAIANDKARKS